MSPKGDWPIFASGEPSTPDNVLTTYDTTSRNDGRSMPDGESLFHYGIQIRIRGVDHKTGWAKGESVLITLTQNSYADIVIVDSQQYRTHCIAGASLLTLGKESPTSKRNIFTINCTVTILVL